MYPSESGLLSQSISPRSIEGQIIAGRGLYKLKTSVTVEGALAGKEGIGEKEGERGKRRRGCSCSNPPRLLPGWFFIPFPLCSPFSSCRSLIGS